MKHLLQPLRWALPALLLAGFGANAQALNYSTAGATNVAGTYTDLAATGTTIATANTDDANSAATPIGFTFNYNGTAFTQFVLNTNGFIRLGAAAPSAAALFYPDGQLLTGGPLASTNAADVDLVMPFAVDLGAGTGAGGTSYQVATTGTAGSRITTIQWTNVQDKPSGAVLTQFLNFSFQVKLYETGVIEFVYGPSTPATTGTNFRYVAVGLKGSSTAASVIATKGSTQLWSAATFIVGNYTGNAHNIRQTVQADAGRTYRFAPSSPNDAAVSTVYTQGQLATFSPAHVVKAQINNVGTNVYTGTATLTVVRGATTLFTATQPVTALASGAGATVTFAAYDAATMANVGTNAVTVSLGADDNTANNIQTLDQLVSATTVNYASPATATPGGISFGAAGTGNAGSRFTTTAPRQVVSVQAYIASGVGTVSGVLFDATGAELGRSAARTLVAADAGTLVTFTLTTPVNIGAGDFFAGLNLAAGAAVGSQTEVPTRTGAFFQINPGPALVDLATNNLGRFNLGAVTAPSTSSCLAVTGLTVGSITTTSASVVFTAPAAGTTYTITYAPTAGGAPVSVTPAPTASPVPLSGLTAGTAYTVSVTTNCAAGATSGTVTTTFSTVPLPPANDLCSAAIALTCGTPVTGTTVGATTTGDPTTACVVGGTTTTISASPGVFYSLAGNGQIATVSTCSGPTGVAMGGDTKLFVYSGSCGTLTCVGSNDDIQTAGCGTNPVASTVTFPTVTGTTYYVFVQFFGAATRPFGLSVTCAAPPTPVVPTYATLPVNASFENTWVNGTSTRDLPSASWLNTPATGNASWRRDDDGASAGWGGLGATNGGYTPTSSQGARSARFHSYFAGPVGVIGSLDLYANLSGGPGTRTLTFDYVNVDGTDKLDVLVSTDGGVTFAATPLLTANTSATFTARTVVIPSTSATAVIRFRATSDFGDTDIGLDNVQVRIVTATRNEALAATVGLYPNPAHRAFTLDVPAGPLRTAAATLHNALGQVVLARALSATGSTAFDVSGLAAGVYSLELKTGDALVVKRVVVE